MITKQNLKAYQSAPLSGSEEEVFLYIWDTVSGSNIIPLTLHIMLLLE